MSLSTDRGDALRLLSGLENGGLSAPDAAVLAEDLDPVLVHLIVRFLRANYPASDPAAHAVLERVVEMTSASPSVVSKNREGEQDPISEWFVQNHSLRDFRGRGEAMIDLLIDKLES